MTVRILVGDCRHLLRALPEASVHCVVTSPPYFRLRDYGVDGQIGLESSPEAYVAELVEVFREVWRVLRDDGTVWLNLGDSYASRPNGTIGKESRLEGTFTGHTEFRRAHALRATTLPAGYKHKDLMLMPARVALALQADGWTVRQEVIWHKPNPMPESVKDRCTKAHEHIFMLAKGERYYYDAEAIAEPVVGDPDAARNRWDTKDYLVPGQKPQKRVKRSGNLERKPGSARGCPEGNGSNVCGSVPWEGATRNKRSVWAVPTEAFKSAHFATFPPALIEPCIKASTSERGVCPRCGAPWARQTAKVDTGRRQKMADGWDTGAGGHGTVHREGRQKGEAGVPVMAVVTTGWAPTCTCPAHQPAPPSYSTRSAAPAPRAWSPIACGVTRCCWSSTRNTRPWRRGASERTADR